MPYRSVALKTIELLIRLLSNYYLNVYPYQRCRYRYHRLRSVQINTISKKEFTPQRTTPSSPPRTIRTYDQGRSPRYRPLIQQRDTPPIKEEILTRITSLSILITTRKKKTYR
jgi:hypothetical protein